MFFKIIVTLECLNVFTGIPIFILHHIYKNQRLNSQLDFIVLFNLIYDS